jgi:hypothetical protein
MSLLLDVMHQLAPQAILESDAPTHECFKIIMLLLKMLWWQLFKSDACFLFYFDLLSLRRLPSQFTEALG